MMNNNSSTRPKLSKQGQKIKPNKIATANLPPKPYTEYTIFFRLERAHILQSSGLIDEEVLTSLDPTHYDAVEFPRPPKYEQLALPPYWYSSSHKAAIEKKRKHRKREGRMDLKTLSKTISASWRNADPVAVEYCRKLAQAEMKKYNTAIEDMAEKSKAEKKALDVSTSSGGQQHQQQPNSNSKFVVPEVRSSSSQASVPAFQDLAIVAKQQIENSVTTKMMPVVTPPISEVNMQHMNRFNGTMVSGNNNCADPQINLKDEALLQMLQLQAAQQQNISLRGSYLPTSVPSSAAPHANLPKYKRKFVRSPSAPAEYFHKEMDPSTPQPYMGTNENVVSESHIGSGTFVVNTFLGDDTNSAPKKQMRRRSSMASMASHQVNELGKIRSVSTDLSLGRGLHKFKVLRRRASTASLARQGLSASFKEELENGPFTCVPEWEKKDADALLNMLNEPQASEPVATCNNNLPLSMDQELQEFMKNVGLDRPESVFETDDNGFSDIFA